MVVGDGQSSWGRSVALAKGGQGGKRVPGTIGVRRPALLSSCSIVGSGYRGRPWTDLREYEFDTLLKEKVSRLRKGERGGFVHSSKTPMGQGRIVRTARRRSRLAR